MTFDTIERRRDPRTHAFVPIRLRFHGAEEETPAHLLDLSTGGGAFLTTDYNAPRIGDQIDVLFDAANTDGGSERCRREETGVVVNLTNREHGVVRIGVRFLEQRGIDSGLFDPIDTLSGHRLRGPTADAPGRWETIRHLPPLGAAAPGGRMAALPV